MEGDDSESAGFGQADAHGLFVGALERLRSASDDEAAVPRDDHVAIAQIAWDAEAPRRRFRATDLGVAPAPGTREFEAHVSMLGAIATASKFLKRKAV